MQRQTLEHLLPEHKSDRTDCKRHEMPLDCTNGGRDKYDMQFIHETNTDISWNRVNFPAKWLV